MLLTDSWHCIFPFNYRVSPEKKERWVTVPVRNPAAAPQRPTVTTPTMKQTRTVGFQTRKTLRLPKRRSKHIQIGRAHV